MKAVNLQQAKTHLSRYMDDVEKGEVVVVCRHNKPVAEIRSIEPLDEGIPEFGIYDGFGVSDSFFEPLPDDLYEPLKAYEVVAGYLRRVVVDDGIEEDFIHIA